MNENPGWYDRLPKMVQHLLVVFLAGLSSLLLTYLATKLGIPVTPAPTNTVVNNDNYIVPDQTLVWNGAEAAQPGGATGPRLHPLVKAVAGWKASKKYSDDNPGLSRMASFHLMMAIPDSAIIAEAATQKVAWEAFDGSGPVVGGRLSDFLDKHPDFIANLIKLFLALAPLFAHNDLPAADMPAWNNPTCVAGGQLPYPLAWRLTTPTLAV